MTEDKYKLILLEDLDLSVYTFRQLSKAGIKTIYELSNMTVDELGAIRNIGKRQIEEIIQKLQSKGYYSLKAEKAASLDSMINNAEKRSAEFNESFKDKIEINKYSTEK